MFKRQIFIGISLWVFLLFVYIQLFYYPSPAALQAYQDLMQRKERSKQKEETPQEKRCLQQAREQISKQLVFMQDEQRVQLRLLGDHSDLIFNQEGKEQELIEYFRPLTCLMQEKLIHVSDEPKQYMRRLKAEGGIYSYQTGELKANQVQFTRYLLPGHSWPSLSENSPSLLEGEAKEMEWVLYKNKNPCFKAHDFYMTLQEGNK